MTEADRKTTPADRPPKPRKAVTPLEHLLAIMRDPAADPEARDEAAIEAARYRHARPPRLPHR